MTTFTIQEDVKIPSKFDSMRELYEYLVNNVIDLDIQEHIFEELSESTKQKILLSQKSTSFINI